VVLAVALIGAMAVVSHDAPCREADPLLPGSASMLAITSHCYGDAAVLELERVARPVPADDEVLVRVHAASINPQEWHYMRGQPYIMRLSTGIGRPKAHRVGTDFAGTIEAVGASVVRFRPPRASDVRPSAKAWPR
jgi:hypothetical protein